LQKVAVWVAGFSLAATLGVHAAVEPYQPDVHTVFLFHFDEPAGASVATNSAALTPGTNLIAFNGNPFAGDGLAQPTVTTLLGGTGFIGFGNCFTNQSINTGLGLDADGNGGFAMDDGAPISPDRLTTHSFMGAGNTFTLEALVNLNSINSGNQHIISTDSGAANTDRGLQFRVTATGALEFNFVGVLTTSVTAAIPTNGPHAFAAGQWFHTALTYDGTNALFYWTRLDSGATNANLISAPLAEAVDVNDDALLAIGNEGRAVGTTGATEGLLGLIDEVRISKVARGSNEFVFRSLAVTASATQAPNVPENTLDGNFATRWSAQGDGQFLTFDLGRIETVSSVDIAFYQPTTIRTNWFDVLLSNDGLGWRTALTNVAATNAPLANFDFADWPARYVRFVGHLNSVNDFNSVVEFGINRTAIVDVDNDALADLWEQFYFTNLTSGGTSDPDGDAQSNWIEFIAGTNPTQTNPPGDTDGDGLADTWEYAQFGNLSQTAAGDPDADGYSNLAEYSGGSNPNSFRSVPGDTDGDTLPDAWEITNLGGLSYGPYEDNDLDKYTNQAEQLAGTNPTNGSSKPVWAAPRVAFLRDSVVATNACLMPNGSTYGRAINGISFQNNNILLTFNGYQYTAWYDTVGTSQFVWLARRTITNTTVGNWEKFQTDSEFLNGDETGWDAHNVIGIGICPADGTLHLTWDHHNHTLKYRRSIPGLCTTNLAAWGTGMLNAQQNWLVASGQTVSDVTYPQFTITPSGGLLLNRRIGSSGNGDQLLHTYIPITNGVGGNWTTQTLFLARGGTYNGSIDRNAYINGLDYGPDGKLHTTWTWRETASSANHDLCYAYSTDHGVTWRNNAGALIADTSLGQSINLNSTGIIVKPLDVNQLLINQQAQCVDNDGRIHMLVLHRREESGYEYPNYTTAPYSTLATAYYHYFRDPTTGVWTQRRIPADAYPVGSRPKIGFDAAGNAYAVYLSYPTNTAVTPGYTSGKLVVASASKAGAYSDWEVLHALDTTLNGEPLLDQARLLADNVLSVYIQEHSTATSVVGTPLHIFDFVVRVAPPAPVTLAFWGADSLITFAGTNTLTFQLQSASNLSPANWSNVGIATPGVNGLQSLPDVGGKSAERRFYRITTVP
jgi:hypothetical protein